MCICMRFMDGVIINGRSIFINESEFTLILLKSFFFYYRFFYVMYFFLKELV